MRLGEGCSYGASRQLYCEFAYGYWRLRSLYSPSCFPRSFTNRLVEDILEKEAFTAGSHLEPEIVKGAS